jgi:hypothetical protein
MDYSNRKSTDRLKMVVAIFGFSYLIALVTLLFLQKFLLFGLCSALFLTLFILVMIVDFQCIRVFGEAKKIVVRYFPVFAVSRSYNTIEFPVENLEDIEVKKSMFNMKCSVRFSVKTIKGVADYPPVSFSAVPLKDRRKLVSLFHKICEANRNNQ